MSKTIRTQHAETRCAQRAIPNFHLELLKFFGESKEQKGGAYVLTLNNETSSWLRRQLENELAHWDHLQSVYVVCSDKGAIITTGHAFNKKNKRVRSIKKTTRHFMYRRQSKKVNPNYSGDYNV